MTKINIEQILGQDNTLADVQPLSDYHLQLQYADGETYVIDFNPIIARGGVMSALADIAVFSAVKVAHGGIAIEFPGEIDFCADALRLDGELQKAQ